MPKTKTHKILRLISNASSDIYPANSAWHFKNLIRRLDVFGTSAWGRTKWVEIALTDIFVDSRYDNVTLGSGWVRVTHRVTKKKVTEKKKKKKREDEWEERVDRDRGYDFDRTHVLAGFYENPSKPIEQINKWLEGRVTKVHDTRADDVADIVLSYDQHSRKTKVTFHAHTLGIEFGADIARIFGLQADRVYWPPAGHTDESSVMGVYTASVHGKRGNMFIYCPQIEANMMADQDVHLLSIANWSPWSEKKGPTQHMQWPEPRWHVLHDSGADWPEIDIKDSGGLPIQFRESATICEFLIREPNEEKAAAF